MTSEPIEPPTLPSLPPRTTAPVVPTTRPPGQPIPALLTPPPTPLIPPVSRRAHTMWLLRRTLITAVVVAVLAVVGDLAGHGFHLAQRAIDSAVPPPTDPLAAAFPPTSYVPQVVTRQGLVGADGSWKVSEGHFGVTLPVVTDRHLPPVAPLIGGVAYEVVGTGSIFEIAWPTPDTMNRGHEIVADLLSFPWSGPPTISSWKATDTSAGTVVVATATVRAPDGAPYDLAVRALITPEGVVLTMTPVWKSKTAIDHLWQSLTIDGRPAI
jgi:hypothetical protein